MALLIFCWICFGGLTNAQDQPPHFKISPAEINFGFITSDRPVTPAVVEILPADVDRLVLTGVRTDCSCVKARIMNPVGTAKGPARVIVEFVPDGKSRSIRNFVKIKTDHPEQRWITVRVLGTLVSTGASVDKVPDKISTSIKTDVSFDDGALEIGVVYSSSCPSCAPVLAKLNSLKAKYGARIRRYVWDTSINDSSMLEEVDELYSAYNSGDSNESVYVFVGDIVLAGKDRILRDLEEVVAGLVDSVTPERKLLRIHREGYQKTEKRGWDRLSMAGVILAGLADGINPCAFAVIVFFVSLMGVLKKSRRDILIIGIVYTAAVFVTYSMIGVGLFEFLRTLQGYSLAAVILFYVIFGITILFGVLSVYDAVMYKISGKSKDIVLQLPGWMKKKIHDIMRDKLRASSLVFGGILLGFVVALLEFPCTGQVYLPTIKIMVGQGSGVGYLLLGLYNLMFIIPLIIVFIATYYGVKSDKIVRLARENLVLTKVALAIVFFGLALILWFGRPVFADLSDPDHEGASGKHVSEPAKPVAPEIIPAGDNRLDAANRVDERLDRPEVVILYTGESRTHLKPCECPGAPYGGVMRRATLIEKIRASEKRPVLLVDAGGFFPGFEGATAEGAEIDKERTKTMLRAMKMMKYDVVNVGDTEFFYGQNFLLKNLKASGLAAVGCNIFDEDSDRPLFTRWKVMDVAGRKIAFIGVTDPEQFNGVDISQKTLGLKVREAAESVKNCLREVGRVDTVILLAYMDEVKLGELLRKVPEVSMAINAKGFSVWKGAIVAGRPVAFSSMESRYLGRAELGWAGKQLKVAVDRLPLGPSVVDHPEIAALVKEYDAKAGPMSRGPMHLQMISGGNDELSLYLIKNCLLPLKKEMDKRLNLELVYAVAMDENGKPYSPLGEKSLAEIKRQLAVRYTYPEKLTAYLQWLTRENGVSWEKKAAELGIDLKKIAEFCRDEKINPILMSQSNTLMKLGNPPAPLRVNGTEFVGDITDRCQVLRFICNASGNKKYPTCANLPECCTPRDCKKKGFHVRCENPGRHDAKCQFSKAVKVPVVVLTDEKSLYSRQSFILGETEFDFPGAEFVSIDYRTAKGQEFIKRYGIRVLPALIFDKAIEKAANFPRLNASGVLQKADEAYMYARRGVIPSHQIISRPAKKHELDVFVHPFTLLGIKALAELGRLQKDRRNPDSPRINIRFIAVKDSEGRIVPGLGTGGHSAAELEEIKYHLAILIFHPKQYYAFAEERANSPGSMKWYVAARAAGLDPRKIEKDSSSPEVLKRLEEDVALLEDLAKEVVLSGHAESLLILANNQEVIPCSGVDTPLNIYNAMERAMRFEKPIGVSGFNSK